jgi:hypothetical protein
MTRHGVVLLFFPAAAMALVPHKVNTHWWIVVLIVMTRQFVGSICRMKRRVDDDKQWVIFSRLLASLTGISFIF